MLFQHSTLIYGSDSGTECRDGCPNNSTNSISFIHILAASDGMATLPHTSMIIISRFIGNFYFAKRLPILLSKAEMSLSSFVFVTFA